MKYIVTILIMLLVGCGPRILSRERALYETKIKFDNFVNSQNLNNVNFEGPIETSVGSAQYAFEWRVVGHPDVYVLVYIKDDGFSEITYVDEKNILGLFD